MVSSEYEGVKGYYCGSYTVEASVMITAVLAAIFLMIYQIFVMHDKAVMEAAAWKLTDDIRQMVTECRNPFTGETDWIGFEKRPLLWRICGYQPEYGELVRRKTDAAAGELIISNEPEFTVYVNRSGVRIKYIAETHLYLFDFLRYFSGEWNISGQTEMNFFEPEEFVRLAQGILTDMERE